MWVVVGALYVGAIRYESKSPANFISLRPAYDEVRANISIIYGTFELTITSALVGDPCLLLQRRDHWGVWI